jgi:small GTP-binding protein
VKRPPENIATLLTPPGVGAIAVLRLAGAAAVDFVRLHFSRALAQGRCVHGELRDGDQVIDDAVAVMVHDGKAVDLCVHGGAWVVKAVLELARRGGFQIVQDIASGVDAEDLLELEMLAAVPLAKTELALRVLLAQPLAWKAPAIDARAVLADGSLWWLLHPPQVAIVGAANVGKSTLANQLFAQERSITADLPGTTRDWVGEIANLDGLAVRPVYTPGIRATTDAIENQAIARSGGVIEQSDWVVLVLDASRALEGEQETLLKRWPTALRVINQVDRAAAWDLREIDAVQTVAIRGHGVDELRNKIREHFGIRDEATANPKWWTLRQREILERGDIHQLWIE